MQLSTATRYQRLGRQNTLQRSLSHPRPPQTEHEDTEGEQGPGNEEVLSGDAESDAEKCVRADDDDDCEDHDDKEEGEKEGKREGLF